MSEENQTTDLVVIQEGGVTRLIEQRKSFHSFVRECLGDADYGTIPGTKKPSLFKPGAEKLASIFGLGSRIISVDKVLDMEKSFAMFTYTIEIFHLKSNTPISQCQGSANSSETKYRNIAVPDVLNTLQKMAQKRAFVGAVISATGASDFFTQDTEDMAPPAQPGLADKPPTNQPDSEYECEFGKFKGTKLKDIGTEQLIGYVQFIENQARLENKPIQGKVKTFIDKAKAFLGSK